MDVGWILQCRSWLAQGQLPCAGACYQSRCASATWEIPDTFRTTLPGCICMRELCSEQCKSGQPAVRAFEHAPSRRCRGPCDSQHMHRHADKKQRSTLNPRQNCASAHQSSCTACSMLQPTFVCSPGAASTASHTCASTCQGLAGQSELHRLACQLVPMLSDACRKTSLEEGVSAAGFSMSAPVSPTHGTRAPSALCLTRSLKARRFWTLGSQRSVTFAALHAQGTTCQASANAESLEQLLAAKNLEV